MSPSWVSKPPVHGQPTVVIVFSPKVLNSFWILLAYVAANSEIKIRFVIRGPTALVCQLPRKFIAQINWEILPIHPPTYPHNGKKPRCKGEIHLWNFGELCLKVMSLHISWLVGYQPMANGFMVGMMMEKKNFGGWDHFRTPTEGYILQFPTGWKEGEEKKKQILILILADMIYIYYTLQSSWPKQRKVLNWSCERNRSRASRTSSTQHVLSLLCLCYSVTNRSHPDSHNWLSDSNLSHSGRKQHRGWGTKDANGKSMMHMAWHPLTLHMSKWGTYQTCIQHPKLHIKHMGVCLLEWGKCLVKSGVYSFDMFDIIN